MCTPTIIIQGCNITVFYSAGSLPCSSDLLEIRNNQPAICLVSKLRSFFFKSSGPGAF